MAQENGKKINCFECVHYENTWEPMRPRKCRFFGFKSAALPSEVVYESAGEQCSVFEKKKGARPIK